MSLFTILRELVLLRRIAIAVERTAAATEAQNDILRSHWRVTEKRKPSLTVIESFDIAAANKRWHEEQQAAGVEPFED